MPEELYPPLNGEVAALRRLPQQEDNNDDDNNNNVTTQDELREQEQPLTVEGMTTIVSRGDGPQQSNGNNGVNSAANPGRGPHRKVKFLQKLVIFCGDPKRREQTCSTRNKMFAFCKEAAERISIVLLSVCPIRSRLRI